MSSSTIFVPTSPEANKVPASRLHNSSKEMLAIAVLTRPSNGKDHLLQRSRDTTLQVDKGSNTCSTAQRRTKGLAKPEKPKRRAAGRIVLKNLFLLALILSMGRTILKWTERFGDVESSTLAALRYEVRISEVEASLKKTTKMFQDQLEVVDKRIGNEIRSTTKEFMKQIEERGVVFEKELRKLEGWADALDKSLEKLKDISLVSKEEFENFLNELRNSGIIDGSDEQVSLDDVRTLARDIVQKEIKKHADDGLGSVDYAVTSGGARVVRHSEPYGFEKSNSWLTVAKGRNRVHPSAQKMLQPSFGEPGHCFPLQGSQGFVEIRLRTGIILEAVTLEHVSKSVAYDRSSAPKDCLVFAWFEGPDDNLSMQAEKMIRLTEFSYDLEKSNAQTFNVETLDSGVINMIRFEFSSNHGSSSLTCIYRLRVHGYEHSTTFINTAVHT